MPRTYAGGVTAGSADDLASRPVRGIDTWLEDPRRAAVAAIGGALLLWTAITTAGALAADVDPWSSAEWARWDSEHYLSIAERGYEVGSCEGVAFRDADDLCGNAGWFPGYPYLVRPLIAAGLAAPTAARVVSLLALAALFATLWFGFLARRPRGQAMAAMALAAAFPGSVYFGAIFPMSVLAACLVGVLAAIERRRWVVAGVIGAGAAVSYASGAAVAIVAVVPLLDPQAGPWRDRVRAAAAVAGIPVLGYLLVHAELWRTVGRWDAWFRVQAAYEHTLTNPLDGIAVQLERLGDGSASWIGVQTAFVLILVALTAMAAKESWPSLGLGERAALPLIGALWFLPLTLGSALSLWRAESLLVPSVIVLSRLPPRALVVLAVVAVPIAHQMARLYFEWALI